MGSLSNRINRPSEPDKKADSVRPSTMVNATATPTSAAPARSGANVRDDSNSDVVKKRTSPHVAELRRQIRPKLLSAINEADEWKRDNPEHQKIITDRLQIYLQRANIPLSKPEFD
jgi:hypothetical protein